MLGMSARSLQMNNVKALEISTKRKVVLLDQELKRSISTRNEINELLKVLHSQLDSTKGFRLFWSHTVETAKNDPNVRTQYRRLEYISSLFQDSLPHFEKMEGHLRRYLKLVQQRNIVVLDLLDTLSTISNGLSKELAGDCM